LEYNKTAVPAVSIRCKAGSRSLRREMVPPDLPGLTEGLRRYFALGIVTESQGAYKVTIATVTPIMASDDAKAAIKALPALGARAAIKPTFLRSMRVGGPLKNRPLPNSN